ncbi:Hypothetical predicted protein [Mytilus galloprovincialis]|uniref:Uncharacterized protein n=1 Tax=Mytilus galloprovincialis TaxID=29158 RepID=A0A8B6HHK2_MYTGA|nr:Hypothetical predicted protein [Mytilus galloprovincialis]
MFLGKIDQSNNKRLLGILDSIKCGGIDGLVDNLFPVENGNHCLLRTKIDTSFMMLDIFFYRVCVTPQNIESLSVCSKLQQFVKSLQKSESSKFIIDSCKYQYGRLSQCALQLLPPLTTISKSNNIQKLYHRHLRDGIMTDAVSGWLLYASFHYVTGQYNITLKLTEYVLSRCKHDMMNLGIDIYSEEQMNSYRQSVHSKLAFDERIKLATVDSVKYMRRSSLIPEEMQLDVEDDEIKIPPVVLSYCLRFLCHHYLGDICNRQQALDNLLLAVQDDYFVTKHDLSVSKTLLGVCYEISEDITNAYQCYDEAVEDDVYVCLSAKARKSKLLLDLR